MKTFPPKVCKGLQRSAKVCKGLPPKLFCRPLVSHNTMTKSTTLAAPANGVGEELVVLPGPRADQVQPISLEPAKAPQDAKSGKEDYVNRRSAGLREGLMPSIGQAASQCSVSCS